ncbi:MAG: caspase family protein [Bacteroidales bacterium]|nr:caspase family protein [Bacteroidales bacterium]
MRKILIAFFSIVVTVCAYAQEGEVQLNRKYYDTIRKSIEEDIAQREAQMQKYAERTLASLPNEEKLYDESYISVKAKVVDGESEDGREELNLVYNISYNCRHLDGYTDDYPLAVFSWDSSNSVRAICQLTNTFVSEILRDVFANGDDLVTVTVFSTVDGVELSRTIPYDGSFGNYRYMPVTFNGEKMRISVDATTGIRNNCELAYIRAQSVKTGLMENIQALQRHETEFRFVTRSYADTGAQYRRSSIEITVHNPFRGRIESRTREMVQDDYVDFNIPKRDVVKENTYVLVIANDHYNNGFLPDVPYAGNDGEVVCKYFRDAIGVPERQVKLLKNASKAVIKQEGVHWLTDIAQAVATKNTNDGSAQAQADIFVYYAGHGFTDFEGNAYIVPDAINPEGIKALGAKGKKSCTKKQKVKSGVESYDIKLGKKDAARFAEQCIAVDSLCAWLRGVDKRTLLPVNSLTVILDASFDGNQRSGEAMVRADKKTADGNVKKKRKANKNSDAMVLLAASYDKTAYSFDAQHHGFLTYFLLKEIKLAEGRLDRMTYQDIYESVERKLSKESALQGKWQEINGFVDGKYVAGWQRLTL